MIRMVPFVAGSVMAYMTVIYLIALWLRRNDLADVAWGPGFVLAAAAAFWAEDAWTWRGLTVAGLVLIWALRLALHIHARGRGKGEDPRYRKWREEWGRWVALRSFLQVFMLQGFFLLVVAAPVLFVIAAPPTPGTWLDALGVLVWLIGFLFEAIGDWQLLRFTRDPGNAGRLMTDGLWRYTRHPNYFGEVTLWWGIWLIALGRPGGWLTIVGPLTITLLILKVSGIPMLERRYDGRPDFEAYRRRTSPFFPLPPRTGGPSS